MRKIILSLMLLTFMIQAEDIYATFTVEANKSANLAFTSSGTVNSVLVDVSSSVKKGEVLAELDNADLKAALNITTIALKYSKKSMSGSYKSKTCGCFTV